MVGGGRGQMGSRCRRGGSEEMDVEKGRCGGCGGGCGADVGGGEEEII